MRTRAATATAVLAVAGLLVSLTMLWPRPDTGSQFPGVEPGPAAALEPRAPETAGSHLGRVDGTAPSAGLEMPRTLRVQVASADIDSAVRPVGVSSDGQMALPARPEVLGWYRFGPAPGAGTGSVVLAGHLDSKRYGLGPLVGLRQVEAGDGVRVTRSDGTAKSYTVLDVRGYDRQAPPEELFARTGPERLRIITCGGDYLPDAGGYQQNLVVTAVPSRPTRSRRTPRAPHRICGLRTAQYDALLVDLAEQRLDYPQRTRLVEAQRNSAPGPSARRPGAHIPDAAPRRHRAIWSASPGTPLSPSLGPSVLHRERGIERLD